MTRRSFIHKLIAGSDWKSPKAEGISAPSGNPASFGVNWPESLEIKAHLAKAGISGMGDDEYFRGADWNPQREGLYFSGDRPNDVHPGANFMSFYTLRAAAKMGIASPFVMDMTRNIASFSSRQDNPYSYGCRIQKRGQGHSGERKSLTRAEEKEVDAIWAMLNRTEPFHVTMNKMGYDSMCFDWATSEIVYEESGRPYAFRALDAATVRKGKPKVQTGDNYVCDSFVQVVDYRVRSVWHTDEIFALVRRPRTDIEVYGYGYPELQQAYETLMSWFKLDKFNDRYFDNGTLANSMLLWYANMSPKIWEVARSQILSQVKGYDNAHRMMMALLSPGGEGKPGDRVEKIDFMKTNQEMQFTEMNLLKIQMVGAAFGYTTPREVGLPEYKASGTPLNAGTDKEDFLLSREGRLRPVLTAIEDGINHSLVYRYNEDFEISYVFDRETEEARANRVMSQVQGGIISYNEGRERMGDERIDERYLKKRKIEIPGDKDGSKTKALLAAYDLPMPDVIQRAIGVLMPAPDMGEMGGEMGEEGGGEELGGDDELGADGEFAKGDFTALEDSAVGEGPSWRK